MPSISSYSKLYNLIDGSRSDDQRMRRRVAIVMREFTGVHSLKFGAFLERKLGIDVLNPGRYASSAFFPYESFFGSCALSDLFDSIFYVKPFCRSEEEWQRALFEIRDIFVSRQMAFRVDENGTVHPFIDPHFGEQAASLLEKLQQAEFGAARGYVEEAWYGLRADNPEYLVSIRSIFLACENLFKLLFPKTVQLSGKTLTSDLRPFIDASFPEGSLELRSTHKMIASFGDWTDAAHFYRHEEGGKEPNPPSEAFTILFVSQGIGFARWLAALHSNRE